jgi:hypothetical protein
LFAINVSILLLCASALQAHTAPPPPRAPSYGLDLGISYTAEHSLKANTSQSFWMQGGSMEFGVELRHGWGIAADISGEHAASVGAGGVPFSEVTETFGPRYRWHSKKKLSVYGEGLFGEADGFDSVFPTSRGAQTSVNTLAVQVGGGVDYQLSPRFSVRAIEASWVHTQFPNSTDNDQNNIRLGAGVVLRFGR